MKHLSESVDEDVKELHTTVALIISQNSLCFAATYFGFMFEQDLQDVVVGLL